MGVPPSTSTIMKSRFNLNEARQGPHIFWVYDQGMGPLESCTTCEHEPRTSPLHASSAVRGALAQLDELDEIVFIDALRATSGQPLAQLLYVYLDYDNNTAYFDEDCSSDITTSTSGGAIGGASVKAEYEVWASVPSANFTELILTVRAS